MNKITIELTPPKDLWEKATERQVAFIKGLYQRNGLMFPFKSLEEAGDYISKENADRMIFLLKKGKIFETKIIEK